MLGNFITKLSYLQFIFKLIASCSGHIEVVKELLYNGANINIKDSVGHTILNCSYKFYKIIILWIKNLNLEISL